MADKYAGGAAELFLREKQNIPYDNFVIGMSHSVNGVYEWFLPGNTYKFSVPSADLQYQYLLLSQLERRYDMGRVKHIVLELPYYIFNYDLKKAKNTYPLRKGYYEYLEGLQVEENAPCEQIGEAGESVAERALYPQGGLGAYQREQLQNLFRRIKCSKKGVDKVWPSEEEESVCGPISHVWTKVRPETVAENVAVFKKILELLNKYPHIRLTIAVFPFAPQFITRHGDEIGAMRKIFFDSLQTAKERKDSFSVEDYFEAFTEHPEWFMDHCHLNESGAYQLTKRLRGLIR